MIEWIGRFEPQTDVVCPGFARLRYVAACPHGCPYCYLGGTYWRGTPRDLTEDDLPALTRAVERWMERIHGLQRSADGLLDPAPRILNAGELSDSFAPEISARISLRLIEVFRQQSLHVLLLLTKARPVALFEVEPTPQVIVSFSIGQQVYEGARLAQAAPDGQSLVEAAARLQQAGWRVRLRLDPLIDREGVDQVVMMLRPVQRRWERITLGTLRFTRSGYRAMRSGSPRQQSLLSRIANDHLEPGLHPYRLPLECRTALYRAAAAGLWDYAGGFGLCKETREAWHQVFAVMPNTLGCNCTL